MASQITSRQRAETLVEALPYLQKFRDSIFLIKYGGSTMEAEEQVERFLIDIAFLDAVGIRVVLVHGGGKAINARMKEQGLTPQFVNGLRVTDAATVEIVRSVLDDEVNPGIVNQLEALGVKAVGISGRKVFIASKLPPFTGPDNKEVDLGFVGEAEEVNPDAVLAALAAGAVPVISPLGALPSGESININADVSAAALAAALPATKLIFLSDVPGLMLDPKDDSSLIHSLTASQTEELIDRGVIAGGMIPKVRSATKALASGLGKVHLLGAGVPHAVLLEAFSEEGVGTEITP
ncbi:MAG: acetylglutamate kinase [Chthoniobacterales bacterium]|jgi:acetylglutamate kinase|nr:acetylglutamate kinase [Chthoniobacterales bacterium]